MEIPLYALTPPAAVTADDTLPSSDPTIVDLATADLTATEPMATDGVQAPRHRILLSTTSSDSHTWNLMFLQLLLEECGHEVVNLGPCVPDALLVETARSCDPSAIVISTVNGHGRIDGARVVRAVRRDPEIAQLPMVIGGKLGIEGTSSDDEVSRLLEAGFDAVFIGDANPDELPTALSRMLPAGRPELSEACCVC
jgi:methylmalonyl-CoA mutase cobalamin-binding subunit